MSEARKFTWTSSDVEAETEAGYWRPNEEFPRERLDSLWLTATELPKDRKRRQLSGFLAVYELLRAKAMRAS